MEMVVGWFVLFGFSAISFSGHFWAVLFVHVEFLKCYMYEWMVFLADL